MRQVKGGSQNAGAVELTLILARVALGAVGIGLSAAIEALKELGPPQEQVTARRRGAVAISTTMPYPRAMIAFSLFSPRGAVALWSAGRRSFAPVVLFITRTPVLGRAFSEVNKELRQWGERGREEQHENERLARELLHRILPELMDAVIGHLDLDNVLSRVDTQKVIDGLDLDALAARIDVNSIIDRVDLPRFTQEVMDAVDLREVLRESTSTITAETVDAIRYRGMDLDHGLARVMDRILLRGRRGRDVESVPEPSDQVSLEADS